MNALSFLVTALLAGTTATPATPATPTDDPSTKAQIAALESHWLRAELTGDAAFLDGLLDPGYQVIVANKGIVRSKHDLLERVRAKSPADAPAEMPWLHTTVSLNGARATAYSEMVVGDHGQEKTTARFVDFYELREGRWIAVSGVDL